MANYINTENIIKKIYTKDEICFVNAHDWGFIPNAAFRYAKHIKNSYKWLPSQREQLTKDIVKRSKAVRQQMKDFFRQNCTHKSLEDWIKAHNERIRQERKAKREEEAIKKMLKKDGLLHSIRFVIFELKTGEHIGWCKARYAKKNSIEVHEDYDRYTGRCKYWKVTRSFTLCIRKGWHVQIIGGVITFVRNTKIDRHGIACEWIEQGKAINDVRTVKGFLVRGEHIEAKSLKEAQAINAEHRAKQLTTLLAARKRGKKMLIRESSLVITFEDSLKSGNCRPGTQSFKDRYEEAVGHEATSITVPELRYYAKRFGVADYAEKTIRYVKSRR